VRQQINLYQPIFRREKRVLSATTMLQCLLLILFALGGLYGFGRWQTRQLTQDVADLDAQRDETQARVEQLTRELAARQDDQTLRAEIAAVEAELAAKRQLLKWLGEQDGARPGGFAAQLEGLARQHQPGIQLESIRLGDNGARVALAGRASAADELVQYLRRLGREAAFQGLEFRNLQIERRDAGAPIEFAVGSDRIEEVEAQ